MSRITLYALLVFTLSIFWGFLTPLLYLTLKIKVTLAAAHNEELWVQFALVFVLIAGWALLFQRPKAGPSTQETRFAAGFCILFLYLGYTLQYFLADLLKTPDHVTAVQNLGWVNLVVIAFFFVLLIFPKLENWALPVTTAFLLSALPFLLLIFPLEYGHSDIFQAIQGANDLLLHGHPPYQAQSDSHWVRCPYFPGLWLPFLPASALNFDPRFLVLLYTIGFIFLVWLSVGPKARPHELWFLILFLLNPWSLLRQDLYIVVYLLVWAAFFLTLRKGHFFWAALWFGWGLSMHLFSWALLPIWFIWVFKRLGAGPTRKIIGLTLLVPAVIILPFALIDPSDFFEMTLLHWIGNASISSSGLGFMVWLRPWPELLAVIAFFFLGLGAWLVWRGDGSLRSLFQCQTLALGLALMSSYHVEHYYYFVPLTLLLFHEITVGEPEKSGPGPLFN